MKEEDKMSFWSKTFQTPELLEFTRSYMLTEEMKDIITNHMRVYEGNRVLEVGCGTGYLGRYVATARNDIQMVGVDLDRDFLAEARRLAGRDTRYVYVRADATSLPYEDETFDSVISHTFLTSTKEPQKALKEMYRVLKKGGSISSITSMSAFPAVISTGVYPVECNFIHRYQELYTKVWNMYENIHPIKDYIYGTDSAQIPRMFVENHLKKISLFPIGYAFSYSDYALSEERKRRCIELGTCAEQKKFMYYVSKEKWEYYLTEEEKNEYLNLLEERKHYLLDNIEENSIFEWSGFANIMVTGEK